MQPNARSLYSCLATATLLAAPGLPALAQVANDSDPNR